MKENYRLGIKLHKTLTKWNDTMLMFYYEKLQNGVVFYGGNQEAEMLCKGILPKGYFDKFQRENKEIVFDMEPPPDYLDFEEE